CCICNRIIDTHMSAHFQKHCGYRKAWCITNIISIRLEGQSHQSNRSALDDLQLLLKLFHHFLALPLVDFDGGFEQTHRRTIFARNVNQRAQILAEATAAPSDSRIEKLASDSAVQPNAGCNLINVRTHLLAKVGNLIDEANFHREKSIS